MLDVCGWLPQPWRLRVLGVASVLTVGFAVGLTVQGTPLRDRVPGGILAYEFAWSGARAKEILVAWHACLSTVRTQLLWDFPFLLLYPLTLALACYLLAHASGGPASAIGFFLCAAVLLAAPLDAVENVALLRMLDSPPSDTVARVAGLCAGLKFTLVLAAVGYVVVDGLVLLIRKHAG